VAALGDEDIGGLESRVHDALAVRSVESVGNSIATGAASRCQRMAEILMLKGDAIGNSMAMKL